MPRADHVEDTPRGTPRRRAALAAVAVVVATAGTAGVIGWQGHRSKPGTEATSASRVRTAAVKRADLSDGQTLPGTLGHGRASVFKGAGDGMVTWLPATGATVTRGHQLYRVDDRPVPLFYGSTPLFRTLDTVGTVGRDVRVVADNLVRLGYDIGPRPAPGTWVTGQRTATGGTESEASADPSGSPSPSPSPDGGPAAATTAAPARIQVRSGDGVLTTPLIAAVRRWQIRTGMPPTGALAPGDVAVSVGAVRIDSVQAQLGDPAAGPLLSVSSTGKKITVQFDPGSLGSIRTGSAVTVTLPDKSTVHGRVSSVGTVVQTADDGSGAGGSASQLTVTVTVGDEGAVRRLDTAPVQVEFPAHVRKGVLAVPVGALLALSGGGYAVQLPGGRLIAVRTGLFDRGLVEISGSGLRAGVKVVTTS